MSRKIGVNGVLNRYCITAMLACWLLVWWGGYALAAEQTSANPLSLNARSAYMIEARTGRVLYDWDSGNRLQPASLAKLVTFELVLNALEQGKLKLDQEMVVSEKAWRLSMNESVSRMFLQVGTRVTIEELLYGLMVSSGNDAAVVLAEALASSEEQFVDLMNNRVQSIGLENTRFQNSHGLEASNQYTNALDMAMLGRYILQHYPSAIKYTSPKEFKYNNINQRNWNKLVITDARVNGLKTGHLSVAGYHLVASARDAETALIAVVLGAPNEEARFRETQRLLDWGFNQFVTVQVDWPQELPRQLPIYKGQARNVRIGPAEDLWVTVPKAAAKQLQVRGSVDAPLIAPLAAGSPVGELFVEVPDGEIKTFALVTTEEVKRGGFFRRMWDSMRLLWLKVF